MHRIAGMKLHESWPVTGHQDGKHGGPIEILRQVADRSGSHPPGGIAPDQSRTLCKGSQAGFPSAFGSIDDLGCFALCCMPRLLNRSNFSLVTFSACSKACIIFSANLAAYAWTLARHACAETEEADAAALICWGLFQWKDCFYKGCSHLLVSRV